MRKSPQKLESKPGSKLPPWSEATAEDEAKQLAPLAHPRKFVHPLATKQQISIHDEAGTLWATPNGGEIRANTGTRVTWTGNTPFTITFTQKGGTRQPLGPVRSRLVGGMQQADICLLADGALAPYYEYTVTTEDGLTLDPIIIVDKR